MRAPSGEQVSVIHGAYKNIKHRKPKISLLTTLSGTSFNFLKRYLTYTKYVLPSVA